MSLLMQGANALLGLLPKPLGSAATAADLSPDRHAASVPATLHDRYAVRTDGSDGLRVVTLTPNDGRVAAHLLYLPGDAYIHPLRRPHWSIMAALADGLPVAITCVQYPLAPEHTAEDTFPALRRLHSELISTGQPVVIAGDSAGGGLTLSLAIQLRDESADLPEALVLFSPWVDVTMQNPAIAAIEPHDHMLGSAGLIWAGQAWAGDLSVRDPRISPKFDDLAGLPDTFIYQGGRDIFLPDAEAFSSKANRAGTRTELRTYPDAFHVFVGLPQLPESRHALGHARSILAGHAGTAPGRVGARTA